MALLGGRLNKTFYHIKDKMKRRRASNDEKVQSNKQPRTVVADGDSQQLPTPPAKPCSPSTALLPVSGHGLCGSSSSAAPDPQHRENDVSVPSTPSSMSLEYTHLPSIQGHPSCPSPGTFEAPIDLTGDSWPGTPNEIVISKHIVDFPRSSAEPRTSEFSPGSPGGAPHMVSTPPGNIGTGIIPVKYDDSIDNEIRKGKQLMDDEELARALQAEEDSKKTIDLTSPGTNNTKVFSPFPFSPFSMRPSASGTSKQIIDLTAPKMDSTVPLQPSAGEGQLRAFSRQILQTACSKCGTKRHQSAQGVIEWARSLLESHGVLQSCFTCKKCGISTCPWCNKKEQDPEKGLLQRASGNGFKLAWCCNQGRQFLIWALCCGFEFIKPEPEANGYAKLFGDRMKTLPGGPSKSRDKGTGYGGNNDEFGHPSSSAQKGKRQTKAKAKESKKKPPTESILWELYFAAVACVLPSSPDAPAEFGFQTLLLVPHIIGRSTLLPKAMELLRNDSVEEIAGQESLYVAVLNFVVALNRHVFTSPLIYEEQPRYHLGEQLASMFQQECDSSGGAMPSLHRARRDPEMGQPMFNILVNLATQCGHFRQAAQRQEHVHDFKDAEGQIMLDISRKICTIVDELGKSRDPFGWDFSALPGAAATAKQPQSSASAGSGTSGHAKAVEDLKVWNRNNAVAEIDDEVLFSTFHFADTAKDVPLDCLAPGRMKKIVSQLSVLRNSLPEGIYVRYGSSRVDVMKVLMTGPKGTPYENGLFEFDFFCPANFPLSPPMVHFRTTGYGTARFNPNLYADGKVCLSLLGTWTGEQWDREHSTLLQVLVSFQAMIFTEEPWYNEPGRERTTSKRASNKYNAYVQSLTLEHAMIYWLKGRIAPSACLRTQSQAGPSSKGLADPGKQTTKTKLGTPPKLPPAKKQYTGPTLTTGPTLITGSTLTTGPTLANNQAPSGGQPQQQPTNPGGQPVQPGPSLWYYPPSWPNHPLPQGPWAPSVQMMGAQLMQQMPYMPPSQPVSPMPYMPPLQPVSQMPYTPPSQPVSHMPYMPLSQPVPQMQHMPPGQPVPFAAPNGSSGFWSSHTPVIPSHQTAPAATQGPIISESDEYFDDEEIHYETRGTRSPQRPTTPPVDDNIWGEVIRRHFSTYAKTILEVAKQWKATDRCTLEKHLQEELEQELKKHGFL